VRSRGRCAEVFCAAAVEVEKRKLAVPVVPCGLLGGCHSEPLVEVCVDGLPSVTYGKVNAEIAMRISRNTCATAAGSGLYRGRAP